MARVLSSGEQHPRRQPVRVRRGCGGNIPVLRRRVLLRLGDGGDEKREVRRKLIRVPRPRARFQHILRRAREGGGGGSRERRRGDETGSTRGDPREGARGGVERGGVRRSRTDARINRRQRRRRQSRARRRRLVLSSLAIFGRSGAKRAPSQPTRRDGRDPTRERGSVASVGDGNVGASETARGFCLSRFRAEPVPSPSVFVVVDGGRREDAKRRRRRRFFHLFVVFRGARQQRQTRAQDSFLRRGIGDVRRGVSLEVPDDAFRSRGGVGVPLASALLRLGGGGGDERVPPEINLGHGVHLEVVHAHGKRRSGRGAHVEHEFALGGDGLGGGERHVVPPPRADFETNHPSRIRRRRRVRARSDVVSAARDARGRFRRGRRRRGTDSHLRGDLRARSPAQVHANADDHLVGFGVRDGHLTRAGRRRLDVRVLRL